ncbi:MAG: SHOCT domain-containing protein [Acidobacteria bacterium]|nr:SHOCT domain-containing protein [Acidobacteriota bacterium]
MQGIAAGLAATGSVLADGDGWGHMGGWGWGMAIFGWLFMTMVVVLVAWLIWSTTRRAEPGGGTVSRAVELLDQRYARGELNRDQYLEQAADLER